MRSVLPVAAFVTASWSTPTWAALPPPEDLVPNTVARISHVSDRAGTVTKAEFRHALVVAAAAEDLRSVPRPDERRYEPLAHRAVDTLLETVWIKGQAMEMGIVVTRRQVRRELAAIKRENFSSAAEYRRFLKETRYTPRDVYERVELQLLSARLLAKVQARIARESRTEAEEQKAFNEFVDEFNVRWRSRTVCAPEYVTSRCSNGPP